jgi:hypothetical protein
VYIITHRLNNERQQNGVNNMLSAAKKLETEVRSALRKEFGIAKYRIEASGAVSVYSQAPNSVETCWWLFAQSNQEALARLNNQY